MLTAGLLLLAALFVAFANGANDNAKGIATLVGSGMAPMEPALRWANLATFLGAAAAIPMALYVNTRLVKAFGGGGLLPKDFTVGGTYLVAVGLGAALTVFLATRFGIPISTTHALMGALIGAGLVAVGPSRLAWSTLGARVVLPLLLSPLLAAAATMALYPLVRLGLKASRVEKELCLCVEETFVPVVVKDGSLMLAASGRALTIDEAAACRTRFAGEVLTISADKAFTVGQLATSGLVSFARGLNDTPKIVGIVVAAGAFAIAPAMGLVAVLMLLGGLLFAKRVAKTMSERITRMDGEQGFVGSLVTAALVIAASLFGLPVSTTHVSCGALFGIGLTNGSAKPGMIAAILAAWVTTLPLAAALAAGLFAGLRALGT
jgi:inorganic phosphate transporter, PiT family